MLERLLKDHDRLRDIARRLAAAVSTSRPPSATDLEEIRWELARESLQHLAHDERQVLAKIEQFGDDSARAVVATFRADLDSFNAAFREHMEHWTGSRVAATPSRYARSVRQLVSRLEDRLAREEQELYPLAYNIAVCGQTSPARNWAGDAWAIRSSIAA